MLDDLKNMATDAWENILNSTDLDEQALAMVEEKIGAENIAQIKQAVADGTIDQNEMVSLAEKIGVPQQVIDMVVKFYQDQK